MSTEDGPPKTEETFCPCCGTRMDLEESGNKTILRCPACGVTDVRLKN